MKLSGSMGKTREERSNNSESNILDGYQEYKHCKFQFIACERTCYICHKYAIIPVYVLAGGEL